MIYNICTYFEGSSFKKYDPGPTCLSVCGIYKYIYNIHISSLIIIILHGNRIQSLTKPYIFFPVFLSSPPTSSRLESPKIIVVIKSSKYYTRQQDIF